MIFNTFAYYILFLIPSAVLFRLCSAELRPWVSSITGIGFYLYFSSLQNHHGLAAGLFVFVLILQTLFKVFYKSKAFACTAGIIFSIVVLGIFKYWNFTIGLLDNIDRQLGYLHWQEAFLPLGLSFYTFEFIHFATDSYKSKIERGSLIQYFGFIFFFPTMVAGPIKRFQDFLPYLEKPNEDWVLDFNRGITRILVGLVKKFAIADLLTSFTNHLNKPDILQAERWVLLLWLFAYGWKIYFDFSAYSDIAIGSARLFGVNIPENFNWPYFRRNISEFWRHWHISLYTWLVEYIFIPLGGSRGNNLFVCRNIMIIMLVSGIWHGAGLNFIAWGAWHGILLVIYRLWSQINLKFKLPERGLGIHGFISWFVTYISVNFGWAFFAMDLDTSLLFFRRLLIN